MVLGSHGNHRHCIHVQEMGCLDSFHRYDAHLQYLGSFQRFDVGLRNLGSLGEFDVGLSCLDS
jgi:hypothetical protein